MKSLLFSRINASGTGLNMEGFHYLHSFKSQDLILLLSTLLLNFGLLFLA